ncbi:MAG: hypothetical protein C0615_05685 [Desulfuromonas sp.]|nr:MAG: hypothetical protein C0615_05685 [Desulfuromonas sp.]
MTRFFHIAPLFLLLLLLLGLGHGLAQEAKNDTATETEVVEVVYPGLEQVVPRSSQIDADAARTLAALDEIRSPDAYVGEFEKLNKGWTEFKEGLKQFGAEQDWPVNRLLNVRGQVDGRSRALKQLLDQVGMPLRELEQIRKEWTGRLNYWSGWKASLESAGAKLPKQTFSKVQSSVLEILDLSKTKATALLQLQEKISRLREEMLLSFEKYDVRVSALRRDPFRRNAHPLFSVDFLQQMDSSLFHKTADGVRAAFQFESNFFQRQGWLLALQAGLALVLIVLFRKFEQPAAEKTDDWQFIFQRPYSASLFIALAASLLFYSVLPPPLVQFGIIIVAAVTASRLAGALLPEGNQRTLIYVLTLLFILTKGCTTIALPLPLYRLYLSGISVFGVAFLFWIVRRHHRHNEGRTDSYILQLYGGSLLLVTSLLAQVSGYATFAMRLLDATIGTVFVVLFAMMALRIAEGAIELFFHSHLVSNARFVKNLGPHAAVRFTRLSRIGILIVALLSLLEVWGLFDSISAAWQSLLSLEYSIGEFHLSVKMVVLVIAVLYSSILVSWFFQSFLESQVFFGKRIDRGVRDAFKKLSHYALILIGFVVAMTMAGIELQNFAILAGAFGIGIGFGLQDIVNNFVSGLIMLFERPVKVGDAVIIDGQWGAINKIGMRSTVVETWDHSELIVPNSHMISEKVLNWTLSSNVSRITLNVGVRYGTDLEKVIKILNKVGDGHPAVVADPAPSAIFTEFGDSSINFELRVWVDDIKHRLSLISDLGLAINKEFKKAGVEIPYPQRDLHLRSVAPEIDLSGPPRAKK